MRYLFICFMLFFLLASFTVPDRMIHGKITDEKGNPIAGVTVLTGIEKINTISDDDGNFKLPANKVLARQEIIFSAVGYETKKVRIHLNDDGLTVQLKPTINNLPEIIVVASGVRIITCTFTSCGFYKREADDSFKNQADCDTFFLKTKTTAERGCLNNNLKIYPNPASKNSTIHLAINGIGNYFIQLISLQSQLLFAQNIHVFSKEQTVSLPLPTTLAAGNYFVRISNAKTKIQDTEKLIIQ